MFQTLRNAWNTADLKKKILFSLFILLLYRIGAQVPVPFLSASVTAGLNSYAQGNILEYLNILSGGAFGQATLFALGISPYITASIVIQLLTVAIPPLERLAKEGADGQKKLNQITRYTTVGLALLTALGYYFMLRNLSYLTDNGVFAAFVIIACYCAGSSLVMWLAEKINESGIGNGISLILFVNIVSRGPAIVNSLINFATGKSEIPLWGGILITIGSIVLGLFMVCLIVFINDSERRLPVQYAKKVVGRKMYGGQNSTLPIKLNNTGVMPIIFASSIVSLPATIKMFANPKSGGFWDKFLGLFDSGTPLYAVLTLILIIAFAYFYILISFNPVEVSNNLKKNGGSIPGIRPGKPTSDYITKVLNRITLIGALFLAFIAVVPMIINMVVYAVTDGAANVSALTFGGSSIIIIVGVVLETAKEIEGQMTMRHYKGFLE